jgi:hypothetical protein
VNDEQPPGPLPPHVLDEQGVGRAVALLLRGNGQQSRRLDNDHEVAILKEDIDGRAGGVAAA